MSASSRDLAGDWRHIKAEIRKTPPTTHIECLLRPFNILKQLRYQVARTETSDADRYTHILVLYLRTTDSTLNLTQIPETHASLRPE